jgi:hypothetical protein
LNGKRKTDKLDARALCLRLSRWLDGNRDELAPIRIPSETEQRKRDYAARHADAFIRIPSETEQRKREATRRQKFLAGAIRKCRIRGSRKRNDVFNAF